MQRRLTYCRLTQKFHKYVRLPGQPYIHTCRSYAWPSRWTNRTAHATRRIVRFWASWGAYGAEKQSSPKCEISRPGRRRTTVQNLTLLALYSAEKSSTVTHVHAHTSANLHACRFITWKWMARHTKLRANNNRYLAYRHVWIIQELIRRWDSERTC